VSCARERQPTSTGDLSVALHTWYRYSSLAGFIICFTPPMRRRGVVAPASHLHIPVPVLTSIAVWPSQKILWISLPLPFSVCTFGLPVHRTGLPVLLLRVMLSPHFGNYRKSWLEIPQSCKFEFCNVHANASFPFLQHPSTSATATDACIPPPPPPPALLFHSSHLLPTRQRITPSMPAPPTSKRHPAVPLS
jgi:hypothetical protein